MDFIIDGNNVALSNNGRKAKLEWLLAIIKELNPIGTVFPVVSASLKYRIDDQDQLTELIKKQVVWETPAGEDTDLFILELARKLKGYIVSNDRFRQYKEIYPSIVNQRFSFLLVEDKEGNVNAILPWIKQFRSGN